MLTLLHNTTCVNYSLISLIIIQKNTYKINLKLESLKNIKNRLTLLLISSIFLNMENKKISYGELSDLNLKLLIVLTRSTQSVLKKDHRTIKEGGLTVSQFAVLEMLYHKGDLRISEIIEKALSSGGNMTVIIDNLVREDLVKRCSDPNDRRVNLISITEKGRKLVGDIFPKHLDNINEIFSVLTVEEKRNLINLLKKLSGV